MRGGRTGQVCVLGWLVAVLPQLAVAESFSLDTRYGLRFISPGEHFKLRLGGRLHLDGVRFHGDDAGFENDSVVRRARVSLRVDLFDDWRISADYDLMDEEERYQSLWLRYRGFERREIKLGQFTEPFGLENSTSSNAITFLERALPDALIPGTNVGVAVAGDSDHGHAALGLFWQTYVEDASPFESREGMGLTGRITWAPLVNPARVVHLGVSGSLRVPDESDRVRFRARPETAVTDARWVNTGRISDVNGFVSGGMEAALVLGPLSVQGEYVHTWLDRDRGFEDERLDGAYVYASFFLTGEHRPYVVKRGGFGKVSPSRPWGAWEVALRRSFLDLNGNAIEGGREDNLTWAVNWYVHRITRVMVNYIRVRTDEVAGDVGMDIVALRLQVAI